MSIINYKMPDGSRRPLPGREGTAIFQDESVSGFGRPHVQQPGAPSIRSQPAPAMAQVLVVDDHPQIRRLIQVNLEKIGLQVVCAVDGEEGLARAEELRPDLIILDVMMPRKSGFEVLRDLKASEELGEIPVIMLTVKVQNSDIAEGLREGADFYLPKPFHPTELCDLVERVLKQG
jgi:CheY-like chemotaxis protein